MEIISTIEDLRKKLSPLRLAGKKIGLVPTMGALHLGHAALIDACAKECDVVVVSVFLNPIQFGANEDLDSYPRRLAEDGALAQAHGAHFVFAPSALEMYPSGAPLSLIRNESIENKYCGAFRPGHFRGVLTVVAKLFLISGADNAYFGKKDYQQVFLIEQMVSDLNFPVKIIRVPIVREESGLALSSRNEYLTKEERAQAVSIYSGLKEAEKAYSLGERATQEILSRIVTSASSHGGVVQYAKIARAQTLEEIESETLPDEKLVILVAVFFGETRLIDNIELSP